jgi:hypothetical protein
MVRQWWGVLAIALIPLLVWGFDRLPIMHWLGHTDLTVEFMIASQDTGQPIPGARIDIRQYDPEDKEDFVLHADLNGMAGCECPNSTCFGTRSALGFTDSFTVRLPYWCFRVSASGFESSNWIDFHVEELHRRVQRVGPGKTKLVVPVSLPTKPGISCGTTASSSQ